MNADPDEVHALRRQLASLVAEAARNDTIARRAQRRERLLLQSRSLEDLLENMVGGLRASFGLDAVSVALADADHEIHHLLKSALRQRTIPTEGMLLVDDLYDLCAQYAKLSRAALGPFRSELHAVLFPETTQLKSVALVPLGLRGRLIGVLNLASRDAQRFTPEHATDFLNHLGTIAAFCVENAVNRARLLLSGLTDVLTGWHNRRYLDARLPEEVARARREETPLCALIFDLDFFKQVNDRLGHLVGDDALKHVADVAAEVIRDSDVAARFGGEEFVVVLPHTALDAARVLAERLADAVRSRPFAPTADATEVLTVSIGVAQLDPRDGELATAAGKALLSRADEALYAAKSAGRDRVVIRT